MFHIPFVFKFPLFCLSSKFTNFARCYLTWYSLSRGSPGFSVSHMSIEWSLLRRFLQVHLLEQQFDFITYFHIPRSYNHVFNAYANYVLNSHLSH